MKGISSSFLYEKYQSRGGNKKDGRDWLGSRLELRIICSLVFFFFFLKIQRSFEILLFGEVRGVEVPRHGMASFLPVVG